MKYSTTFLPAVFLLLFSGLHGQKKIMQLKADSVRIFSNCDTAELILENRTWSVLNGVLTNKGSGVTEFRKVMQRLGDTALVIGGDTLNKTDFNKNIYNANGLLSGDRVVNGNNKNIQFSNSSSYLISNKTRPVIISRTAMDSSLLRLVNTTTQSPYTGLVVRGTGCDATIELVSDSAGTCNETQAIDFTTLKPRKDSWLTGMNPSLSNKFLLGRIQLETSNTIADFSSFKFAIKSDTAFYKDGAYVLYTPGKAGGYTPYPAMTINPSFKHPTLGYNTRMPYVQVNGGLFVGYGRSAYFNSRNANDIINGVDDVAGYLQPFYDTRFSVYADSLPLKLYKLPSLKGNAFLTYSPTKTVEGHNVAFEYKDSIFEQVRSYISMTGLTTPSNFHLKENITVSRFNTSRLMHLVVKDFNYKADKGKIRYTGLIAQELKSVIPALVTGTEGNYSIDYIKMVPYLLKLLQQQQREITQLKQQQHKGAVSADHKADIRLQIKQMQQQLLLQQQSISLLQQEKANRHSRKRVLNTSIFLTGNKPGAAGGGSNYH